MAYQGKFTSKNRQSRVQEDTAAPRKAQPKDEVYQDAGGAKSAKRTSTQSSKKTGKKSARKRKGSRTATTIFYTIYFLCIIGFFAGMYFVTDWLDGWLVEYEASQPTSKCEEIFTSLFSSPDWAALYETSGVADTDFENADTYAAYMTAKAEGNTISYAETSAGLSAGYKYLVTLGDETIGYFTLSDHSENLTDLPDWELDEVVLYVERSGSVEIESLDGHTVSVNGVTLDDSYIIQISSTLAEDYLPAGTTGLRTNLYRVEGLLAEPTVSVTDDDGTESTVTYNSETGVYEEQSSETSIGPEEKERALLTAENYSLYMGTKSSGNITAYFDTTSNAYKTITSWERYWVQEGVSYAFADETVSDYARYADDLFSAHVSLTLNVTRSDGSVKGYDVDTTFFFELQSGVWKCYEMTNVDISQTVSSVRITFKNGDTILNTNFYSSDGSDLVFPVMTAPDGQTFAGWYTISTGENGSQTYTLVFTPDEDGTISVADGTELTPMTLYPLFEDASGGEE